MVERFREDGAQGGEGNVEVIRDVCTRRMKDISLLSVTGGGRLRSGRTRGEQTPPLARLEAIEWDLLEDFGDGEWQEVCISLLVLP